MLQVRLPGGSWGHASREPLGVVGTLLALVWGFIPFTILIADAAFPDKEVTVRLRGGGVLRSARQ